MKNNIVTLLLMAVVALPFTSCKKDKETDPEDQLVGIWTMQQSETTFKLSEDNEQTVVRDYTTEENPSTVTLTSGGQILVKDWDEDDASYIETSGSYEIRDGKLYASVAGELLPFDNGFNYSIAGNTLTITGTDMIFVEAFGVEVQVTLKVIARR